MKRFYFFCTIVTLFLLGSLSPPKAEANQPPPVSIPLPFDGAVSVLVTVSANWQSLQLPPGTPTKPMTLMTDISAYQANQTPSRANFDASAINTMQIPNIAGWSLFKPDNNRFSFHYVITDKNNRLGSLVLKELATGNVLQTVLATPNGSVIDNTFTNTFNTDYYEFDIMNKSGNVLYKLSANSGVSDTVVPFVIGGSFTPFRLDTIRSTKRTTNVFPDITGPVGNPIRAGTGSVSGVPGQVPFTSVGGGTSDSLNDNSAILTVHAPGAFATLPKHAVILDTASAGLSLLKSGDPVATKAVVDLIASLTVKDLTPALTGYDQLPYSDVSVSWEASYSGTSTAVMIVPYRKKMNNGTFLDILVRGIMNLIQPGASALTSLAKTAGDSYLNSPNNASGYLPGDIATLGDAYTVDTREFAKNAYTVLNVYQDVIFTLSPDIAPPVGIGSGVGRVDISVPNTTPSPSANFDTSLVFSAPSWMTTKKLPKGFKYKITNGMITPPNGYQPSGQPFEFFVPGSSAVSVPCVLTVILKLKITSDVPCTVTVKRNGMTFSQGTTISVNNENVYIIDKIQPATYEISGIGITLPPGHSPKMGSDSKTITPIPAVEVDVALKLIKTP